MVSPGGRRSGRRARWCALALAAAVLAGSCSSGDDGDEDADGGQSGGMETPTFEDSSPGPGVPTSAVPDGGDLPASSTTVAGASGGGTGTSSSPTSTVDAGSGTTGAPKQSVAFDDPVGDATRGLSTSAPPPWTDLAGASLERQNNAYRLSVRLGGAAPSTAPGAETMNIATYFDIDLDGDVEYELWVNLGSNGWGPVWYDDKGGALPGDRSNVTVVVNGDRVQLLFPDVMLEKPERLRFSVASEYGPLSSIGSATARRDDAPDNDQAVSFPT